MVLILNDTPSFPTRTIGAYRIATALRDHGVEVEVIDFISHWPWSLLVDYVISKGPLEWVGFSSKFVYDKLNTQPPLGRITYLTLEREQQLFKYFKDRSVPIVVGGPEADTQRPWLVGQVDWVVKGYADTAVIALHDHLVDASNPVTHWQFEDIKVIDANRDYTNWDMSRLETRFDATDFVSMGEIFPIEISRGCRFKCSFCTFSLTGKAAGTYTRPMDSIGRDISERWHKYGGRNFYFLDDTFNDSLDKMRGLAELRSTLGLPWEFWAQGRLDLLKAHQAQQDLVEPMGWMSLSWGIDTFNRSSGSAVGKGADPRRLKEFLQRARERWPNRQFMVHIVVGLPHDTENDMKEAADWFINNPGLVDKVNFIPLFIHNNNDPYGRTLTQPMADDPSNWGYTTKPTFKNGKHWISLEWATPTMTMRDAYRIIQEQHAKLGSQVSGELVFDGSQKWPIIDKQDTQNVVPNYLSGKRSLINKTRK
jgi:hypothetical protein